MTLGIKKSLRESVSVCLPSSAQLLMWYEDKKFLFYRAFCKQHVVLLLFLYVLNGFYLNEGYTQFKTNNLKSGLFA